MQAVTITYMEYKNVIKLPWTAARDRIHEVTFEDGGFEGQILSEAGYLCEGGVQGGAYCKRELSFSMTRPRILPRLSSLEASNLRTRTG